MTPHVPMSQPCPNRVPDTVRMTLSPCPSPYKGTGSGTRTRPHPTTPNRVPVPDTPRHPPRGAGETSPPTLMRLSPSGCRNDARDGRSGLPRRWSIGWCSPSRPVLGDIAAGQCSGPRVSGGPVAEVYLVKGWSA